MASPTVGSKDPVALGRSAASQPGQIARDVATLTGRSAGEGDPEVGALAEAAGDLGPATEALGPLLEVAQAMAGASGRGRVEPAAVVVDLQHPAVLGPVRRHPAGGGLA